jgi:hypothetical protein
MNGATMKMSAAARRSVLAAACLLVLPVLSAAPAHGDPALPPLPPAPGYPPPGVIVPGSSPPIALGNPPVVGPLPPSTIDARGVDLSFTTDESQPILGMPGSRLGTPLTRIGVFGETPDGGVSVGYTGPSAGLEDLVPATRRPTGFPTSKQLQRRQRPRRLAAPRTPICERDEPAASPTDQPHQGSVVDVQWC